MVLIKYVDDVHESVSSEDQRSDEYQEALNTQNSLVQCTVL